MSKQTHTIRFERLVQEVAYVDVEAASFAEALVASSAIDAEELDFEFDDVATDGRVYSVTAAEGTTMTFEDIGQESGFRLEYPDLRDCRDEVGQAEKKTTRLSRARAPAGSSL